ncbi:POU domain, class 6, transcription factor 1-like [Tubulanus polymorphus]|uniref:POU domain, class 6, transcription factor 1-like n=1 Tax=Tubulanus polymorphus TaxID=672921 RepID=UPI003DA4C5E9
MLSGSSNQSPMTSSLSLATMAMPTVAMANAGLPTVNMGTAGLAGTITDQLFMSVGASNGDTLTTPTTSSELKPEVQNLLSSAANTQLLGQPQVAPQFIMAGSGGQGTVGGLPTVQQFFIPVSTANGAQQLLSIPMSLGGGQQQIQLLTSNGQLIATNLAGLPGIQTLTNNLTANHHPVAAAQPNPTLAATQVLPQLLTNAQGQIIALGTQVLQQPSVTLSNQQQAAAAAPSTNLNQAAAAIQAAVTPHITIPRPDPVPQALTQPISINNQNAVVTQTAPPTVKTIQQTTTTTTQQASANNLPPNVSSLLPNTVSQSNESTTVDGINLDEIKEFAKQFKIRRLSLGLTQTQVGQALSATEGPAYSQSAICRFEKLDITPKSAQKIKPVLERWMLEAEDRYKNGVQNLTEFIGSEPSKKRKRRTSFTPAALEVLNDHFERNTHPSGAEMTDLSNKLNYDREVIRVWFCNKRQALKNTIKKLKQEQQ